jgi:hypothetical protein
MSIQRKGRNRVTVFRLPFHDDDAVVDEDVRTHLLCSKGLRVLLNFGRRSYLKIIMKAAKSSGVLPNHKGTGKVNYQAVEKNELKYRPLKDHFEYLQNLGEV